MGEKKILIVDDEESIRDLFKQFFSNEGYTVTAVETGEEALELLKNTNIQVMFLDLNLPGMNGVELCEKIRMDKPIAVIYAVTGYPSVFELLSCREAGFDDYFKKPVKLEAIRKAAEEAFEKIDRWTRA